MISAYCLVSGFGVELKETKCDRLVYKSNKLGNACVSFVNYVRTLNTYEAWKLM